MLYQLIPIPTVVDSGFLSVVQSGVLPFEIKRTFYIYKIKADSTRGRHANMHNKEFVIALQGSVHVFIADEKEEKTVVLSNPSMGVLINEGTWVALNHFSDDCILLVFNSEEYNQKDYVYTWEEYIELKKQKSIL